MKNRRELLFQEETPDQESPSELGFCEGSEPVPDLAYPNALSAHKGFGVGPEIDPRQAQGPWYVSGYIGAMGALGSVLGADLALERFSGFGTYVLALFLGFVLGVISGLVAGTALGSDAAAFLSGLLGGFIGAYFTTARR